MPTTTTRRAARASPSTPPAPSATASATRATARLDSNAERQVYAFPPNDGAYQKWKLIPDSDARYWQLINVATGFALDGTLEDVYTHQPNNGAYQRWRLVGPA